MNRNKVLIGIPFWLGLLIFTASSALSQTISPLDRSRAEGMLRTISDDIQKHYYDQNLHGVEWKARVQEAKQKIDSAPSLGIAFSNIAWAIDVLNDSHTFFLPPQRPSRNDYGWEMMMVGDHCYVTRIRPGSDAEAKRLNAGDEVVAVDGIRPTRADFWKLEYLFHRLQPQLALRVELRAPDGKERTLQVAAKFRQLKRVMDATGEDIWDIVREDENEEHLLRARYREVGDDLMILKLPEFIFSQSEVDDVMGKARKRQALILDLRGNPGGAEETLKYVVGDLFDSEIKIGDRVGRKASKPIVAKSLGKRAFSGKLAVLIDHDSASASELLARIVQLEKRGIVMGDASAGAVMEAKEYSYQMGDDTVFFYGASITDADIIMSDGKSLEHVGVTPDEVVLPTAADLAAQRDPAMARAAQVLGFKLTPEEAGKFFPYEWPRD